MYIYDGIIEDAKKMASKAKDFVYLDGKDRYIFKFDKIHWRYDVYLNDEYVTNMSCKTQTMARKWFKEWLNN